MHATHCREVNCQHLSCAKMKRVVEHTKTCQQKTGGGCCICQEFTNLCCYHAKLCLERVCFVPFCRQIKLKLRQLRIQRYVQSLVHATHCREFNCQHLSCAKMKRVVEHTKTCQRKSGGGCRICQEFTNLCCYHAKLCLERVCFVPFCRQIKLKLRQLRIQRYVQSLVHATHCCKINCQHLSCATMKRVLEHTKTCPQKTGGRCRICQGFILLCSCHAKHCLARVCVVPFCRHIKLKLRQLQRRPHSHRQRVRALFQVMPG